MESTMVINQKNRMSHDEFKVKYEQSVIIMKKYRGLIILDGDETLWSFKWKELIWASELEPPLRLIAPNEIIDKRGVILYLRPGTKTFLEKARKDGFLLSMASHNDWEPNVKAILELLSMRQYFFHPQVDWRSKDLQVDSILEAITRENIDIPVECMFFLDDRSSNLDTVKRRFPFINCHLITPQTLLYPDVWNWMKCP